MWRRGEEEGEGRRERKGRKQRKEQSHGKERKRLWGPCREDPWRSGGWSRSLPGELRGLTGVSPSIAWAEVGGWAPTQGGVRGKSSEACRQGKGWSAWRFLEEWRAWLRLQSALPKHTHLQVEAPPVPPFAAKVRGAQVTQEGPRGNCHHQLCLTTPSCCVPAACLMQS